MHRKKILNLLENYLTKYPLEKEKTNQIILFIEQNPNCFERTLEKGHLTGSAFLLNYTKEKILLTHHKKLNKWLQLGGHADGNTNIIDVALQEAKEESGIEDIQLVDQNIFDIDIHHIPKTKYEKAHIHYDIRFLCEVVKSDCYYVSNESYNLKWVPFEEIKKYTQERSILQMINKYK